MMHITTMYLYQNSTIIIIISVLSIFINIERYSFENSYKTFQHQNFSNWQNFSTYWFKIKHIYNEKIIQRYISKMFCNRYDLSNWNRYDLSEVWSLPLMVDDWRSSECQGNDSLAVGKMDDCRIRRLLK
jgi:hypothetical protein